MDKELPTIIVSLSNFIGDSKKKFIEFPINVNFSYQEERFKINKPILGEVIIEKIGNEFWFEFKIKTELVLVCDRCLKEFNKKISLDFKRLGTFEVSLNDEIEMTKQHHSEPEFDEDVRISSDNSVNLFPPIWQEIVSSIPEKNLCKKTCRGLCSTCGINLNDKKCNHSN